MMKLGTDTGSVINHLHSRATRGQPDPKPGMGATLLCWTDRHACTITGVTMAGGKVKHIEVKEDIAKRTDKNGLSESQEYEYTTDLTARPMTYRLNKKGFWEEIRFNEKTGRWNKANGLGLRIGVRETYRDPSF